MASSKSAEVPMIRSAEISAERPPEWASCVFAPVPCPIVRRTFCGGMTYSVWMLKTVGRFGTVSLRSVGQVGTEESLPKLEGQFFPGHGRDGRRGAPVNGTPLHDGKRRWSHTAHERGQRGLVGGPQVREGDLDRPAQIGRAHV